MVTKLTLPYPPLILLERDGVLTWDHVAHAAAGRLDRGASICLLRPGEPEDRGGYFFHIRSEKGQVSFRTFDRDRVLSLSSEDAVRFINHVAGRRFDDAMWSLAQRVNLRGDDDTE